MLMLVQQPHKRLVAAAVAIPVLEALRVAWLQSNLNKGNHHV
jgi:hypothetical protein